MEPTKTKIRDYTNMWIMILILVLVGTAIFSIAIEILKFTALVKWIFS